MEEADSLALLNTVVLPCCMVILWVNGRGGGGGVGGVGGGAGGGTLEMEEAVSLALLNTVVLPCCMVILWVNGRGGGGGGGGGGWGGGGGILGDEGSCFFGSVEYSSTSLLYGYSLGQRAGGGGGGFREMKEDVSLALLNTIDNTSLLCLRSVSPVGAGVWGWGWGCGGTCVTLSLSPTR